MNAVIASLLCPVEADGGGCVVTIFHVIIIAAVLPFIVVFWR